jgi:hypothetical protein
MSISVICVSHEVKLGTRNSGVIYFIGQIPAILQSRFDFFRQVMEGRQVKMVP